MYVCQCVYVYITIARFGSKLSRNLNNLCLCHRQSMNIRVRCRLQTVETILRRLGGQVDPEGRRNVVNVTREDILDGARRGFRRATFRDTSRLSVRFSGEAGVDDGGPTREFVRLVLKGLRDSHIFEGPETCKMLATNIAGKYLY